MLWFVIAVLALCAFTLYKLRGENLVFLDQPTDQPRLAAPAAAPSPAHHQVVESLQAFSRAGRGLKGSARLAAIRDFMDSLSDGRDLASELRTVPAGGPRGEWVLAPGANPRRRLLYIHGGAWMAGSPRSHRSITNRLSLDNGCAVFSLDYRLMPEHRRRDGIEDCRDAYRWLLENGPDDTAPAEFIAIAGDSAGGNLTLSLIAWVRDVGLRTPDAAVAFSPATDGAMTSPSLRGNLGTDPMLGPAFGKLTRIPGPLLWWATWLGTRFMPSDPVVSPLRGDLRGLPPLLIQASEAEMLLDDARRYARKAQLAGSPVELQTWPHMVHVWQIFTPELPEAEEAYREVAAFLQRAGAASEASPA
ncbi:alpha/beta hydrolase [Parahaliea mediterranea]|uniref:Alpha/beta hydrolase n=1 Tax=Parahaliea mediterranea TaxID=651086 RepID=A0A939DGM1_9GAMM|nr:alpha/beta hydrolase [Parahaliea mediterranea]MBN7797945.1 alpha/beta hydrolase [Parahaliea mediterranea]